MDTTICCILCLCVSFCLTLVGSVCRIPEHIQKQVWSYNLTSYVNVQTTVHFTRDTIEFKYMQDSRKSFSMKCVRTYGIQKYLFEKSNNQYKCLEIISRSRSILQLKYSSMSTDDTKSSCDERNLHLDATLLVSLDALKDDFIQCPFSAGFNMKIRDSNGNIHGCNNMALPMRMESECIAGEGITFDFRISECTNFLPMGLYQKTFCVTNWDTSRFIFIVIKSVDSNALWVLRVPKRGFGYRGNEIEIDLFTHLVAEDSHSAISSHTFYTLFLEKIVQKSFCEDEYDTCPQTRCTSYVRQQCPKSCGECNPKKSLPVCSFPRRFSGEWYSQSFQGTRQVNITGSSLFITSVGHFTCVVFDDSPPRSSRTFTTESLFDNGCRPRYTCISFKRLEKSVIGYGLSQSIVWPFTFEKSGSAICDSSQFRPDEEPVGDLYHTYPNAFKPILSVSKKFVSVPCDLPSTFTFSAEVMKNRNCSGEFYQDCTKPNILRMEYNNCRYMPSSLTYYCAATFRENYWEKLIVLQNTEDKKDSKCLTFSTIYPDKVRMLATDHCDIYSWQYVDVNIRRPLVTFDVQATNNKCKHLPTTTAKTTTTVITTTKQTTTGRPKVAPSKSKQPLQKESPVMDDADMSLESYKENSNKATPKTVIVAKDTPDRKLQTVDERRRNAGVGISCWDYNTISMLVICHRIISIYVIRN